MNRIIKDALYGVVGGIAGTVVINQVMAGISKLQSAEDKDLEKRLLRGDPKEKLARRVVQDGLGIEISKKKKTQLAQVIHWSYGAFWGGVYGLLRKRVPASSWAMGLPYGISFALLGEALMLPMMGLTPPATKFPASSHARGLISHYAYAATVEGVCKVSDKIEEKTTGVPRRTKGELRRVS